MHFAIAALTVLCTNCWGGSGEKDESHPETSPHSERGGIGLQRTSQALVSPSQIVTARRSLAVTETAILSQFSLLAVFNQLAAQNANASFTGTQLFRQLWDTQNPGPGQADLLAGAHCTDNGSTLNSYPLSCRTAEGTQANAANITNINAYSAIGLFNRFDLAPNDGSNCGEYRIVFGKTGGGPGRNFIIFEATLPNPRQNLGLEGCRQVQAFWRDLTGNPDINARAAALKNFYFTGLPGYSPVIHMENFGFNPASTGQLRVNMFMGGVWLLKEFKLLRVCPGGICKLKAEPVTVKTNPFGELFNPNSFNPLAGDFQLHFLSQVSSLAQSNVNTFNYQVPDQYNAGQSDSQSFGGFDDYVAQFAGPSVFRDLIQSELNNIGSSITPDQIVMRAQALSCGGCHQSSTGANLGNGIQFPLSAGFVHNSESTEGSAEGPRFVLSSALTNTFLPFRKNVMEEFLSAEHPITTISRFNMVGSAADAKSVYWVENRPSGSVVKASLNSGSEVVLAFNRPNPIAVATDGVNVYWAEAAGAIFKVPVSGGASTSLATGLTGIVGLASDGTSLFWAQNTSIIKMSVNGGLQTPILTNRIGLTGRISVNGSNIYWQEGNNIQRATKTGAAVTLFLSRASITGLAADDTHVYLAENLNPGNILRLPVAGGAPVNVFNGLFNLSSVAVGATNFVWTSNTNPGPVMTKVKN
ncbi:hypothetical protein F0U59_29830 [Archangium gephyra]|nr:hypothetical protein F0U59_29830 [Archangium gephyra]